MARIIIGVSLLVAGLFACIESCKNVEKANNFPNSDISIKLERSSSKLQYKILKGNMISCCLRNIINSLYIL